MAKIGPIMRAQHWCMVLNAFQLDCYYLTFLLIGISQMNKIHQQRGIK